ncbi:UDP-glucosyltransferase 2-like [Teleopsis dalmanni]|uniref:UDP-glucosyltransferase 2-like n=1 Tax=Teleopsis dalmanni TaxID=139649 RepID=UPI0018CCA466|nr:UDP-glucosyltransferase 2-like [Teleopsis dalmanni]
MKFGVIFLIVLGSLLTRETDSAKILSVFAYPGPSQYIFASAILKKLTERGHEVTSISMFPQQKPVKNFRDIYIPENANLVADLLTHVDEMQQRSKLENMMTMYDIGLSMCPNVFRNKEIQKLLKSSEEKFDLIIIELFLAESLYGLARHFNAPIVGLSTFGTTSFIDRVVGNTSPPSFLPSVFTPFDTKMTYRERLSNFIQIGIDNLYYNFFYLPKQEEIYKQFFPNAKISLQEIQKKFSLVLLNQHFSLSYPRPYVTNMIEVGGVHIKQIPDLLPQELQAFLDNATEGAIYFSMGSNLKSKDLPPEKLQIFVNVFRSLKQKVLWKFEDTELPNKPDNVYISKWYPQPSVLAHPNVKAFITHGGLLSTTEAIYHAKPVLGIPRFFDQPMNVANAVKRGYAKSVDFKTLNETDLKLGLSELLYNPIYTQNVQIYSKRLRDHPMTPLETAIFWLEYVLRHDGALHLRNTGADLNFWQYHSIDIILTILGVILFVLSFITLVIYKLIGLIYGKRSKRKTKSKQN